MGLEPFDAVVARHHAEIFRFLGRMTGQAADDLSQETFLRAFRAYRALPEETNVRAWLYTIAANLARNHYRSEHRRRAAHATVKATGDGAAPGGPEAEMVAGRARAAVEASVERLPLKQRLAFVLRKVHQLDYDAIGRSLGCSPESARAHVFQALKKVRASLDGHLSLEVS
jgi:RNA polymerase sigma-70 factor (ECF subfamily)